MISIPAEILKRLADSVHRNLGLHFPPERWTDLVRGVEATCRELGLSGVEACTRELIEIPLKREIVEVLGRHLTIGETYFFREETVFRALSEQLLPPLLERRRRGGMTLRFWSAACSTGEEPYSLAILLRRLLPDLGDWNLTILATDINKESLRRAEEGVYREWSFRGVQKDLKETWFTRTPPGHYRVRPEVRKMVTFAYHNLVDDPYPSLTNQTNAMDVIFCRNVLMYFSEQMRRHVMEHLERSLVDEGLLVVGGSESTLLPPPGLVSARLPDAAVYRKSLRHRGAAAAKVSSPRPSIPATAPPSGISPPRKEPARRAEPPSDPFLRMKQAYGRGDYEAVCRHAASLSRREVDLPDAALMVARSCANMGRLQEALSWVEQAISLNRVNAEAHYLRAMILDEQNKTPQALDALRVTIYLAPDFIPAYVALGNIYRRLEDQLSAERNFRNALLLLEPLGDEDAVPHSEEMRAGRLREAIIAAMGGYGGT
jgi:chemotaxis protein methyltransferase CheR